MELGMIGLGRMGSNMVRRLLKGGHRCVVFNRSPKPVQELVPSRPWGAHHSRILWGSYAKPCAAGLVDGPSGSGRRYHRGPSASA